VYRAPVPCAACSVQESATSREVCPAANVTVFVELSEPSLRAQRYVAFPLGAPACAKIVPLIEKVPVDAQRPVKLAGLKAFAPVMVNVIGLGRGVAVGVVVGNYVAVGLGDGA